MINSLSVVWIVVVEVKIITEESARDLRSGLRRGKQTVLCLWIGTDVKAIYPRCALFGMFAKIQCDTTLAQAFEVASFGIVNKL